jgi:hypothetical protein
MSRRIASADFFDFFYRQSKSTRITGRQQARGMGETGMKLPGFGSDLTPVVAFCGSGRSCDAMLKRQHQALSGCPEGAPGASRSRCMH